MSYQDALLDQDNAYSSTNSSTEPQIPSTEAPIWNYIRVIGLIIFFAIVLFLPAILHDSKQKQAEAPFEYTYLSCQVDHSTHECTTPYSLYKSTSFAPYSVNETIIVRGHFDDIVDKTGWGSLQISSFKSCNDKEQMKAVGYLEGYLTSSRITHTLINSNTTAFKNRAEDAPARLASWLQYQQTYIESQIDLYVNTPTSPPTKASEAQKEYWSAVELIQLQHFGLKLGYEQSILDKQLVVTFDLNLWTHRADFGDIFANLYPERTKNCWDMSVHELDEYIGANEHCSSISKSTIDLIGGKVECKPSKSSIYETTEIDDEIFSPHKSTSFNPFTSPNNVIISTSIPMTDKTECDVSFVLDFAVAHDTWTSFSDMLRIIKVYQLQLHSYAKKVQNISTSLISASTDQTVLSTMTNFINTISHRTFFFFKTQVSNLLFSNTSIISNFNADIDPTVKNDTYILSLSGYPGMLTSYDDYYVLPAPHQQLIVTETTNSNCDKELYTKISSRSILTSKRTLIASLISFSSLEWANTYARENSGTYNNQWMIVDGKKWDKTRIKYEIVPKDKQTYDAINSISSQTSFSTQLFYAQVVSSTLDPEFYVIAEQMPGAVVIKDVTPFVNANAYWPSFNRPYSADVYFGMGFDRAFEAWGDFYSYTDYARAQIMARDLPAKKISSSEASSNNIRDDPITKPINTASMFDLMNYMRYNDYKNDNLSRNCAVYAIASRYDLIPQDTGCGIPASAMNARGQTDVKVATMNSIKHQSPEVHANTINNSLLETINVIDWTWNSDIHTYQTRQNAPNGNGNGNDTTLLMNSEAIEVSTADLPLKTKPTNSTDAMYWVISGPTTTQQAMFTWNDTRWDYISHVGLPDQFDFNWVQLNH